ncbi:hypothetical protein [Pseudomonas iridis]|uniref:hypothetical protein n=1 Tax=Pseudomonas iridis TaxID=2710587 RepID=UPI001B34027A|nr:hypothetical protein [Pseudomonas iridis]MBP5971034.1 hypothetical protein [Pseudomonas iridis]
MSTMISTELQANLRRMDADLELHGRAWVLDGDILRCRACASGQLASKSNHAFIHASACAALGKVSDYPWHDLVKVLYGVPAPDDHNLQEDR